MEKAADGTEVYTHMLFALAYVPCQCPEGFYNRRNGWHFIRTGIEP